MSNANRVLGKLQASEKGNWVTHNEARAQIRALCKAAGVEITTFASKNDDRKNVKVPLKDGSGIVTAERKVGAEVVVVLSVSAADVPADVLAAVLADGQKGLLKIQTNIGD